MDSSEQKKIKTVVVFAAGRGTRMGDLSKQIPKHLLPVFKKPFLHFVLNNLQEAGFEKIVMVVGHLGEQIENYLKKNPPSRAEVVVVNQLKKMGEKKYGTLIPLLAVEDVLSDEKFVVVMGDNLYSLEDLRAFQLCPPKKSCIGGLAVDDPSQYGTLVYDENFYLQRIDEKVPKPQSDVINAGLYVFSSDIFPLAKNIAPADNGEYQITDAISALAKSSNQVLVKLLQDYWLDFGRPEDIVKVEKFIEQNNLFSQYGLSSKF